jgi:hypothetical protein
LNGLAVVLVFLLCFNPMGSLTEPQALAAEGGSTSSDGVGIKVASWALTVPYCLGKALYAGVGAIIGGFTYVLSGGNTEAAKDVWVKSIYGTYILRPEHLRGEEPVHFVGKAKDE